MRACGSDTRRRPSSSGRANCSSTRARPKALGFDTVAVSDHFQPWRHNTGHAPNALVWLGALGSATERVTLATSVLTPTMRYHPSIVAQSFATLACLNPGRVVLGVGTGEAMNETPATMADWPGAKERRLRMAEAIKLIRQLWTEERVTLRGRVLPHRSRDDLRPARASRCRSTSPPPARSRPSSRGASATASSARPARSPSSTRSCWPTSRAGAEAAGRDSNAIERYIEIKVSYDHDLDYARQACNWWAALALSPDEKSGVEDPLEMERLADAALDRAHTRFIVTNDPEECARAHPAVRRPRFHAPRLPRPGRRSVALPGAVLGRRAAPRARAVRDHPS